MSMVCCLQAVGDSQFERLMRNPEQLGSFIGDEDDAHRTFLKADGNAFAPLEKSWHGLQYLLTGQPEGGTEPFCYLTKGGRPVAPIDFGYGPGRMLNSKEVADFEAAVSTLSKDQLRRRFNPAAMMAASIYPQIWDRDPRVEDTFEFLWSSFQVLQRFLREASSKNKGALIWLG